MCLIVLVFENILSIGTTKVKVSLFIKLFKNKTTDQMTKTPQTEFRAYEDKCASREDLKIEKESTGLMCTMKVIAAVLGQQLRRHSHLWISFQLLKQGIPVNFGMFKG